MYSVYMVMELG